MRHERRERLAFPSATRGRDAFRLRLFRGVGVVIEAEHSCMTLRGVNMLGSTLTTSRLLGVIRDDPRTREEFVSLVRGA